MADLNDEYFMSLALSQARHAWDLGEIPVGAVIVNAANEIVSVGCNRTIIDNDPCAHAEIVALRNAGKVLDTYRLTDLTMYVTLEPCCMCSGALIHARLKRLVYGAKDPKTGACGSVFDVLIDSRHSSEFLANLETLFTNMRSNFPLDASFIILLNSSRLFTQVPVIPSSAYISTNSISALDLIYSV